MEVHEATFRIKTYECCSNGKVKIASLMQYLQEAAAVHAEALGFGFERLSQMNGYWVLSNFRMDMTRLPAWGDELMIRTWPSGFNRVSATREFVGKDRDDRELFRAGSEWMILDKLKNRPKNLFRLHLDLPKDEEKALSEELIRLERHENYQMVDHLCVPYSSIDLNGHVNNTEYVRWGFDALRKAFGLEGDVRRVQINYRSEIFEGDELDLLTSSGTGGHYYILGRKPEMKTDVYVMEVTY